MDELAFKRVYTEFADLLSQLHVAVLDLLAGVRYQEQCAEEHRHRQQIQQQRGQCRKALWLTDKRSKRNWGANLVLIMERPHSYRCENLSKMILILKRAPHSLASLSREILA